MSCCLQCQCDDCLNGGEPQRVDQPRLAPGGIVPAAEARLLKSQARSLQRDALALQAEAKRLIGMAHYWERRTA